MPTAATPTQATRREALPLVGRSMEMRGFHRAAEEAGSAPLATAELVFTTGAGVMRYDWIRERRYLEVLSVEEGAIRLGRLRSGAPLLNSHRSWDLEAQLGVIDSPQISGGVGTCRTTFSRRPSVAGYVQDVEDRVIRNCSVGYVRHRMEMVPPPAEGGLWEYRVVDWEPYEVSLVPIPADPGSVVRSASEHGEDAADADTRTFDCEVVELVQRGATTSPLPMPGDQPEETTMTPEERAAQEAAQRAAQEAQTRAAADAAQRAALAAAPAADAAAAAAAAAAEQARQAEQNRSAEIATLCAQHGVGHLSAGLLRGGQTLEQARTAVLNELAARSLAGGGHRNGTSIQTVSDEMGVRLAGIEQAVLHRISAATQLDDNGRQFRSMSLLEMGRSFLESHHVDTRGMSRMDLATEMLRFRSGRVVARSAGMQGTTDFVTLFQNVASRRLRSGYEENASTYQIWARRAPNAPDFKNINVVQISGAPELLRVNEHGEFTYGTVTDAGETYAVLTYGRIIALTRQAIVNDDLRAFDRLVTAFGSSASRLENRLVYAQLTGNPKMGDGVEVFHANHSNVGTGAGSALGLDALKAGRASMRLQKGLAGEKLNITPAYMLVPAALEQTAYQLTSANYVPAKAEDVNEFRAGGRTAVTPVVEPLLDDVSVANWYLAAANSQVDTVEYCFLDGEVGPQIESHVSFETDGLQLKAREDFAAKVIDFRGLYRGAGA
jgi:hypothetical protein